MPARTPTSPSASGSAFSPGTRGAGLEVSSASWRCRSCRSWRMEWDGIRIDAGFFHEMSRRKLARELQLIQEDIWKEAGEEFNINSNPAAPGDPLRQAGSGGHQADQDRALDRRIGARGAGRPGAPLPIHLLEYRQLEKLRSTYVDALPRWCTPPPGRIHTSFNQTVAATGRLSSSDPNLQNIPIRTDARTGDPEGVRSR
jgi:DNA polymerase I